MPRRYTVGFKNVTVSAAQDLVAIKPGTAKPIRICRVWLFGNDTSLQTAQMLRLLLKYTTGTLTLGSGGTSATAVPFDPGDTAFAGTAHVNDTTPSTTSTSFVDLVQAGGHNYAGFDRSFGMNGPIIGAAEGFVFSLLSTVTGTCNFSGGVEFEEFGG
jgi:hypothetical protein